MDKSKGRSETGRMSTDILSRIRNSAASKPEHQIRHLTEENRRLVYELGIARVDLARLQGEQEQLVEAYGALEKRHDDEVGRLSKELEKSNLASTALEKERDSFKLRALDPQLPDKLKDVANKPARGLGGAVHAQSGTDGSASQTQSTHVRALGDSSAQELKDEVRKLNEERDEADKEIQDYRDKYSSLARAFQHSESERTKLKEATVGLEKELSVLRRQLADAKNPLLNLGKGPVGSDVSFTKADSVSISEVIEKTSNLNEEIFQAAALLGESLVFKPAKEMTPQETKRDTDLCRMIIGGRLTEILISEATKEGAHEINPFLVQVVFRTYLVRSCHHLVEMWQPNHPRYTEFMELTVYKAIRDSEEQAVSGRWRSLTRKHMRPTTDVWKEKILKPLSHICHIAKWDASNEDVWGAFEERVAPIFKAIEELRLAIGVQFTSADIHIASMESGQPFIRGLMEDAYGDGGSSVSGTNGHPPPPEIVLGTVGFGLKRKDRLPNGNSIYTSVQPAKVALVSTVLEALTLPPRTRVKPNQ